MEHRHHGRAYNVITSLVMLIFSLFCHVSEVHFSQGLTAINLEYLILFKMFYCGLFYVYAYWYVIVITISIYLPERMPPQATSQRLLD